MFLNSINAAAIKRDYFFILTVDKITSNLVEKKNVTVLDMKDGYLQIELINKLLPQYFHQAECHNTNTKLSFLLVKRLATQCNICYWLSPFLSLGENEKKFSIEISKTVFAWEFSLLLRSKIAMLLNVTFDRKKDLRGC